MMLKYSLCLFLLLSACLSHAAEQQESADVLLERIKLALLDATLEKEVRVVTAGYLDSSGRLVESTYFGSDLNVAGVRVLGYLEEPVEGPEVDLASLPSGLRPLFAEACSLSELGTITRNVQVVLRLDTPSLPLELQPPRDTTLSDIVSEGLEQAGFNVIAAPDEVRGSSYQMLLERGRDRVSTDYELEILVQQLAAGGVPGWRDELDGLQLRARTALRDLVGRNPLIALPPAARTAPVIFRISYRLTGPEASGLAEHELYYRLPSAAASLVRNPPLHALHQAFGEGLKSMLASLSLREDSCKQLLHKLHPGGAADELVLRAGSLNGLRPGQRLLLLGQEVIQSGLLGSDESALAIGEVARVDAAVSTIRLVTASMNDARPPAWALPF
jgi:hypothetical protein